MKQARPSMSFRAWTKQGPKLKDIKPVFKSAMIASYAAAAKGLRSRGLDGARERFKNA